MWININQEITFNFCVFLLQERAFEMSQKYKEGKFIIELSHMIKDNGWDWEESLQLSSWLFQKLLPLCLKGFQSSFLIPCTSHRCATLSLFTALPTIACDAFSICALFFPATTTTRVQIFLVQLLVVLRHGISECMDCMPVCGHLGGVVTHVRACGMLKWVLGWKPYRRALNFKSKARVSLVKKNKQIRSRYLSLKCTYKLAWTL